jgi:hypothetical protein
MIAIPPREPMRTGGGGALVEVVLGLTALGAAALASLAVWWPSRRPSDEPPDEDDGQPEKS